MTAYTFDAAFQTKIAAYFLRDTPFCHQVDGLVRSEYFTDPTLSQLIWVQTEFWKQWGYCPSLTTFMKELKDALALKRVKIADMGEVKNLLATIYKDPLNESDYVAGSVADFARHMAVENATLDLVDALENKGDVTGAGAALQQAFEVGAVDTSQSVNFADARSARTAKRKAQLAGSILVRGITTGFPDLDKFLTPWDGWGRKELAILMAPPKAGKTAGLIGFAANAAKAGHNVFYASCEVGDDIIQDRADCCIADVPIKEIKQRADEIDQKIAAWEQGAGILEIQRFPTGTLKVSELKRILKRFEAQGVKFDMIVVDYIDIMAPERIQSDKRHELTQITQDLRALMIELDAAGLTATQTNKEGTRKARNSVTDGTDAAEDYNKVRLADALITINRSEDDWNNGELVLYFADMRNAESGIRLRFGSKLSHMRLLTHFIGREA